MVGPARLVFVRQQERSHNAVKPDVQSNKIVVLSGSGSWLRESMDFDNRELSLSEPLRRLRIVHSSA